MRTNDARNLAVFALVGMTAFVGCAKEPPALASASFFGTWRTNVDGHQLTIEFKNDGSFDGKLADEKKFLGTERSANLVLLTMPKKWKLIGRYLEFELAGTMEVVSVTADTLTLIVGGHETVFQRADADSEPASGP
jgi:hypothetical protein